MSKPLVSVLIPAYNRPAYLRQAVASALSQTYGCFEVIVADDASPRPLALDVPELEDGRVRLHRNAVNLGIGLNVVDCLRRATGKYVAFLNDDDAWEPTYLEELVAPLEGSGDLSLSFCDFHIMDRNGRLDTVATDESSRRWGRDSLAAGAHRPFRELALVRQSVFSASAAVVRRDVVTGRMPEDVGVLWDFYLNYLACDSGMGAFYVAKRLARYRLHPAQETAISGHRDAEAKVRKGRSGMLCHATFARDARMPELRSYFEKQWAEHATTLAIGLIRTGRRREARPHLRAALRRLPSLRSLAAYVLSYAPETVARRVGRIRPRRVADPLESLMQPETSVAIRD